MNKKYVKRLKLKDSVRRELVILVTSTVLVLLLGKFGSTELEEVRANIIMMAAYMMINMVNILK